MPRAPNPIAVPPAADLDANRTDPSMMLLHHRREEPADCARQRSLLDYSERSARSGHSLLKSTVAVGSSTINSLINPPRNAARNPSTFPRPETTQSACLAFCVIVKSGPLARLLIGISGTLRD